MKNENLKPALPKEGRAVRETYGVNREIREDYDLTAAVKCANGTFVGRQRDGVTAWRGIPFALAPTDALRWRPPQPAKDGDGVYEAYYNGKSPIQTELASELASYYPQGEDCLYLNVWADTGTPGPKTVMVFFHGGSYGWGGTADPLYDGFNLVRSHRDIVLVTAGYRTGLFGFADFSGVPGGEDYSDAPNLGLLDQIEALRWVKRNIAAFGGDADAVTIFGESAGGGSVSLLPGIPAARGLFRRVIAQSGSVALTYSKDECADFTRRLMAAAKASCMADLLALSEQELMKINRKINDYNNFPQRDGVLIPFDAYAPYDRGETAGIDFMIGTNANELNYWIGEAGGLTSYWFVTMVKFENDLRKFSPEDRKLVNRFTAGQRGLRIWRVTEFYNELMFRLPAVRQAESHAENGGRVYMYYWTEPSSIPFRKACHAVELAYVFGNLDRTIYTGRHVVPRLSELTMDAWVQFAKTGDPSTEALAWQPYDTKNGRPTMILSAAPHVQRDLLDDQREQLSPLLGYWLNASYENLSLNVPFVHRLLGAIAAAALAAGGILAALVSHFRRSE